MTEFFIEVGDEMAISVFLNNESRGAIIMKRTDEHMLEVDVYCNDSEELIFLAEALRQATASVEGRIELIALRDGIKKRIQEMTDDDREGREDYPPSPADIEDIPF